MNCFSGMVLSELKNGSAAAKLKLWHRKIMPKYEQNFRLPKFENRGCVTVFR